MKSKVKTWYEGGCNFYAGVMLLRSAGVSTTAFDALLNESYIPISKRQYLQEAIDALPETDAVVIFSTPTPPVNPQSSTVSIEVEPQIILDLRAKAKTLHKLHADRHSQLYNEHDEAKRLLLIIEIMEDIIPGLDAAYDDIRRYKKEGVLPQTVAEVEKNYQTGIKEGIEKFQKLMNLKTRISKLGGKNGLIDGEKNPERKKVLEKELLDKRAEAEKLQAEISG